MTPPAPPQGAKKMEAEARDLEALYYADAMARRMFVGRKGHGGTPFITRRVLRQRELRDIIAAAHLAGAAHEASKARPLSAQPI